MPIVGRVGVGPASPGDPIIIAFTIELLNLGLQINRLPRRAPMHPAQPPNVGKLVGWEIPVVRLRDQRVFYGQIIGQFARSPRPVTPVELATVVGVRTL